VPSRAPHPSRRARTAAARGRGARDGGVDRCDRREAGVRALGGRPYADDEGGDREPGEGTPARSGRGGGASPRRLERGARTLNAERGTRNAEQEGGRGCA